MVELAESFPPAVYIIGAQKAGTTSLAKYLDAHPQICMAKPKEPNYFSGQWHRGEAWYRSLFSPTAQTKVLIDASTSYSMAPINGIPADTGFAHVPERIHACRPDAKFIYVLRDPVERAYSGYWHAVRGGDEKWPLERAISMHSNYIRGSRYAEQVEAYRNFFPADRMLFVEFRSFIGDPVETMRRIEEHIGIDHYPLQVASQKTNESFLFNKRGSFLVDLVGGQKNFRSLVASLKRILPASATAHVKRKLVNPIPVLDKASWDHIYPMLAESYDRIQAVTGIHFEPRPPTAS